ncbi:hypothetical protein [Streptomyces sp. NPDC008150]|uniref:hypothetical protein n=1 Tax=Streptomyces sp. NPDC008150 TaxID=3364816 RepID=UPI0036EE3F6C
MPELLVQIGGETLPLRSCHWVLFGPNDCAYASEYGDAAVDAEQAHKNLRPYKRERDREIQQGYRIELLSKAQWHERASDCFRGTCTHLPRSRKAVAS